MKGLKKQILFCDYDGTIYIKEQDMERNIKLIEEYRQLGGTFVIVTGRGKNSIDGVIEKYHIPYDYIIANNGAIILDGKGNKIYDQTISVDISSKIITHLSSHNNIELLYFDEQDKVKYCGQELLKIRVVTYEKEYAKDIEKEINSLFGDKVIAHAAFPSMYYKNMNFSIVEIVSINAGKDKSISQLLNMLNLKDEQAITIGDGRNDIDMIIKYNGFSMETAEKEVKDVASKIFENVGDAIIYMYENT